MKGRRDIDKGLLWDAFFGLLLSAVAHANTLTKVRTVESEGSAQLILFLAHRPSYQVIPALDQQRLVIVFSDTVTKFDASKLQFIDSMIQGLDMHRIPQPMGSRRSLRIEGRLNTSHLTVNHQALAKPTGLLVHMRQMALSSQALDHYYWPRRTKPWATSSVTKPSDSTVQHSRCTKS